MEAVIMKAAPDLQSIIDRMDSRCRWAPEIPELKYLRRKRRERREESPVPVSAADLMKPFHRSGNWYRDLEVLTQTFDWSVDVEDLIDILKDIKVLARGERLFLLHPSMVGKGKYKADPLKNRTLANIILTRPEYDRVKSIVRARL